jgi:hypothetical protein
MAFSLSHSPLAIVAAGIGRFKGVLHLLSAAAAVVEPRYDTVNH